MPISRIPNQYSDVKGALVNSEAELVSKAREGWQSAFDELVRRHYRSAWLIARRYTVLAEDTDDLVQEAFVTTYQRLQQLQEPAAFAGWLAAIIRSKGLMWRRRQMLQLVFLPLDGGDEFDRLLDLVSKDAARAAAQHAAIRESIAGVLATLPERQRLVVHLHYLEGYDYRETATLLNVTESAVRGCLDRARNTLRKELTVMSEESTKSWALEPTDLDMLRDAALFASDPSTWAEGMERSILNGICLTEKGQIASTDTHRLYCGTSSALNGIPAVTIHADLGRKLRDDFPRATKGRLTITDNEAVLKLQEGGIIQAPLVEGEYPQWEMVVPKEFALSATARAGDWLRELAALSALRESGFIKDEARRLVMVFSPDEGRVILRMASDPKAVPDIQHQVSVFFSAGFSGEKELTIAANFTYIEQAIRALRIPPEAPVDFQLSTKMHPILIQSPHAPGIFNVTMPMQLLSEIEEPMAGKPAGTTT